MSAEIITLPRSLADALVARYGRGRASDARIRECFNLLRQAAVDNGHPDPDSAALSACTDMFDGLRDRLDREGGAA
ncbi:MAG: hypothetical protein GEU87_10615 [Alphaproteobacteria bacterium]|nr:hypothetical protein [Alphaproteobacteria bacterium]